MPTSEGIRAMAAKLEACRDYNGLHWPEARSAAAMLRKMAEEREWQDTLDEEAREFAE